MQALSDALPLDRAPAIDRIAVVLQLGPALSVRGGVSAVERLIVDHCAGDMELRHIATVDDGSIWRKLRTFLRAARALRAALHSDERVLVHIHFASRGSTLRKTILAWMTLRAERPLILHAHGAAFDRFYERLPGIAQRLLRSTFARADCFVVLSTQWRDFYTRRCGIPVQRVQVLHNPTSLPQALPERRGRARVQFLFLGRIGERKGAPHLLRAFASLPEDVRKRARLVFAGDGDVEALRALAREQGDTVDVEIHSWVDARQRNQLLDASDVFVLPSFQEGVPMALLEAMASGLPVITTPVGGIPDVVTHGREGYLVDPGDVKGLQAAMRALIEDEPQRLSCGERARERAADFDVRHFAAELRGVYERAFHAKRETQQEPLLSRMRRGIYRGFLRSLPETRAGDRLHAWIQFLRHHKRLPSKAMRYNDVLHRIKTSDEVLDPLRIFVSDKEFMKLYVTAVVGERYVVPTLAVLRDAAAIDAYEFPARCCIKATHTSGCVLLRKGGEPVDRERIKAWLGINYYRVGREANYKLLEPKVIVEPLVFGDSNIQDYKIFCVHGAPKLIQVDVDRYIEHQRKYFDAAWNEQDFSIKYPLARRAIARPANLAEMLAVAAHLSKRFWFVRIDLYSNGTRLYVGEITHCADNADGKFIPPTAEARVSDHLFRDCRP